MHEIILICGEFYFNFFLLLSSRGVYKKKYKHYYNKLSAPKPKIDSCLTKIY